jgi:NAD+ synthase (glutamine-hydrolysing)
MKQAFSIEEIHDNIICKLRDYFQRASKTKAIVGLSGGIDSAVVVSLAVKAFGKENVTAVLMPSPYSTMHSVTDAIEIAENLGIKYHIAPIEEAFHKLIKELSEYFGENPKQIAVENIQARLRSVILMAFSNHYDALVLNTTNKSELAVGYGTLYGDLSGAIMPIADIYKCQVYELARFINGDRTIITDSVLTKAPSAELSIGQKDSDSIPEYPVLDPILVELIDEQKSEEELIARGVEKELLDKIQSLRRAAGFKVHQLPQIIKISKHPILPENKWL